VQEVIEALKITGVYVRNRGNWKKKKEKVFIRGLKEVNPKKYIGDEPMLATLGSSHKVVVIGQPDLVHYEIIDSLSRHPFRFVPIGRCSRFMILEIS
jgi:hypothetical protein